MMASSHLPHMLLTSCTEKHFVTLAPSHQDNNRLHFFHLRTVSLKQQMEKQGEWSWSAEPLRMMINGFPRSAISCPRHEVERMLLEHVPPSALSQALREQLGLCILNP